MLGLRFKDQFYFLFHRQTVELPDHIFYKGRQIVFLQIQFLAPHLQLTEIKQLVNQIEQTAGITIDQFQFFSDR